MKKQLFIFLVLLLSFSCNIENTSEIITAPSVIDDELKPFVDSFVEEANKRGIYVDIDNLDALLVDEINVDGNTNFCGYGWYSYGVAKKMRIEISNSEQCWKNRTYIEKEHLMFHELGHAVLSRPHFSESFPNQSPKSLMCTSDEHAACFIFYVYHDNDTLRSYYLDELLGFGDYVPNFVNRQDFKRTVFEEGNNEYYTDWELLNFSEEQDSLAYLLEIDSTNNNITLSTTGTTSENAAGVIIKRFELNDFSPCDNLKAFSNIQVKGITDGYFGVGFSLLEKLDDGTNKGIYTNLLRETKNGEYSNFLHELYCLSENTDIVSITFRLQSKTPAEIKITSLNVDLFE